MSSRQGELAALLAAHSPADDEEARYLETMCVYAVTLGDQAPAVNCNRLHARTRGGRIVPGDVSISAL